MYKILIVDEDIDMCILLERFFLKNNFDAKYVHTQKKAVQELNVFRPDMALIDFRLVEMN